MKNYKDKQNQNASGNQGQRVRKRIKRRWLIMLLIVVAVLVTGLVAAAIKRDAGIDTSSGGTFTVRRDNLTITVTEGGSIRAHKSIEYKCKVERGRETGDLTILNVVSAGYYVTQEDVDSNMVLVQLDASGLEERLIQEDMELSGDQESVTSATEAHDIQKIQNESDIADAQLRVRFALLDLQKYLGAELADKLVKGVNEESNLTEHISPFLGEVKTDPNMLDGSAAGEELKRLQDDIVMAEGNLNNAVDTLTGTRKLHDANYVSDLDLQRDELNVINRTFSKESAEVSLALFKEYDFPKNAEQNLSDYVEAGRQLQRVYAQCRSRLAQAQVKLSTAKEQLYWQEKRVKEIKQNIEYCTIRAQAPGLVVYGTGGSDDMFRSMRYRGGGGSSGVIAEGETVSEGQTILSMPDTAAMVAEIGVHETEVDKVQTAQLATIVMDAFPDRVLEGEVLEVAPLPDQQRGFMNPDLKVYKTLVSIDGTHDFLRSRMSCKVQILVRQLEDSIIVPIQVVSNRAGRKVCYVKTSQRPQERIVQTGLFNDTFVEIIEGLEVGEEVMLNPPLFSELTGPASFQQQQPIPQRRTRPDANDTETQGQPDGQPRERRAGRPGGAEDGQSTRRRRPPEGGESPQGEGPSQDMRPPEGGERPQGGRQLQLTDEMINRIMSGLAQSDPEKAKELGQLRKSDPEKFKAELMKSMQSMRNRMRQGGSGTRQRQGGAGSEPNP
ncbi:MAG TPA: HlyD family efflux transporter periplasmic adaptor subunit [Sedimentisphaerales bacterium]|nr:HlyD family efflux transporter periplasmic adaptor subunit [Sedimentisphaerales bacterium]